MKPTLVTGANGHLGNNLCRLLAARGESVRAMIRPSASEDALQGIEVETVRGDIIDAESTSRAVDGCGRVYHTAAAFLMWSRDPEREIIRPCVEGTRNVMNAAARAGVEKVVYTSSGATIGFPTDPDRPLDETHHNTTPHMDYIRGKIAAEDEALAIAARDKLPTTVINPGFILGPRFFKPSESVGQILDFVNQGMPIYPDGGFATVDVEDVAQGAILAMENGRGGERYLLSGENISVKELLGLAAEFAGIKPPSVKVPVPVMRLLAVLMEISSKLTGRRPQLSRGAVDEFAGKWAYADCSKAKRELGFTYRPARETVCRTVAWLLEHDFVPERRRRALTPHPSLKGAY